MAVGEAVVEVVADGFGELGDLSSSSGQESLGVETKERRAPARPERELAERELGVPKNGGASFRQGGTVTTGCILRFINGEF